MHEITIRIRLGPSAADQRDTVFATDTLIGDLITYCKKDFRLPEQDAGGEMIRYTLYREQGGMKARLDKSRSLRLLRVQPYEVLYLADERRLWWLGAAAPQASEARPGPATAPLGDARRPPATPSSEQPPQPPPAIISPCSIELAPGCVRQVPESGLIINRDYLIQQLPMSVSARERTLVLIGLQSRLEAVSRNPQGHCTIICRQSWYLLAHHNVYIGGSRHSHGEAVPLEQTVTLLLGRDGWPITIRLHSTLITR